MSEPELWRESKPGEPVTHGVIPWPPPHCDEPHVGAVRVPFDEAVERMLSVRWGQHLARAGVSTFSGTYSGQWKERERANVEALLRAALGEER